MMGKGQAATEFLVTYGWAIMGVMITIGVLTLYGVFDFKKYADPYCKFGNQLKCDDYVLSTDGWATFRFWNNFGADIDIDNFSVTSDFGTFPCNMTESTFKTPFPSPARSCNSCASQNVKILSGTQFEVNCDMYNSNIPKDTAVKMKVSLQYARNTATSWHNLTGDVYIKVYSVGACSDGVRNCHGAKCESGTDCWWNSGACGPCTW